MNEWIKELKREKNHGNHQAVEKLSTAQTYKLIDSLGLDTVRFMEFDEISLKDISDSRFVCTLDNFIKDCKKSLFIWDPKEISVAKGYLFDVSNISEIVNWLTKNQEKLGMYSYLLTSQVIAHPKGYVGTIESDGRGNIFAEVLQKQGVSNHQKLSQANGKYTKDIGNIAIEDFELSAISPNLRFDRRMIRDIIDNYSLEKGIFEVVYGEHLGRLSIVTTGLGSFWYDKVPEIIKTYESIRPSNRIKAISINTF